MIEYIRLKSLWVSIAFFSFSLQFDDLYEFINSSRSFLNVIANRRSLKEISYHFRIFRV
ncbi:hypothetical protein LEP1GSC036_1086 [Leptospira weilii str. 2006001853]|uniref:Uncharacterized protein n=2 Tax=Leptospira weilii TaxID=28184 RepID=A0A828Z208_9LEPT|nr:hypothetical protein LEP1GSC036_1086 [Leptospira weilii str. 2006001853]EMN44915.1 hypothetical protein LEP1GSC086_0172 [Leptospira weilii str. LNT 1234]EMY12039.1 hypothetical protein LEP1GSC043_3203 [Leptospira weilii str. Ecochallenge]